MTAESTVESTIQAASNQAVASSDKAANFAQAATAIFYAGVAPDIDDPTEPEQVIDPDNLPDLNSILDEDLSPLYTATYDVKYRDLIDKLKLEFGTYLDEYFPDLTAEIVEISDKMLGVVRGDNSLMLSPATQQALLDRHADQTNKQLLRTETEIDTLWAGRGWDAPQGQHEQQIIEARTEVQLGINSQSREIMIEQMKLEIDNIRFALTTLTDQKMQVITGAIQYINAIGKSAADAAQYAADMLNSKTKYADLATKYYDVYVQMSQLLLQYDEIRINKDLNIHKMAVEADTTLIKTKVGGAIAAAGAMGDIAAAAYGSQNSIATIAHNTSATQ